jgi:hypothetical protein
MSLVGCEFAIVFLGGRGGGEPSGLGDRDRTQLPRHAEWLMTEPFGNHGHYAGFPTILNNSISFSMFTGLT